MHQQREVVVCVDAIGGDKSPDEILPGAAAAVASDESLRVVLTGPEEVVAPFAESHEHIEAVSTAERIDMDDHPANAVRTKKDSSIVVGCRLVRDGAAHAFFSAGSTGACMAAATLHMGRIKGIQRPAIATILPTAGTPVVFLDVGANADCKPQHLVQFAHMGSAYAKIVLGAVDPSIALLNIGEEPTKGSQLTQEAYALMSEEVPGFVGNVEGRDIVSGSVDVIVTDGFTGNIALKVLEGLSESLLGQVKDSLTESALNRAAAMVLRPSLTRLRSRLDPDTYGGAPLLGVSGVCIIGHGSSGRSAVAAGIRVAAQAARGGLPSAIGETVGARS
ncbi:MAG: phosphate acyltransferase PlsX [Coriobacteriia bacterium]|nr:phosphate acyltransferase PlsX [Coriobacteriia bacterium]